MGRVNGHTAEQVIEAIRNNNGLLAAAARELGIDRSTVWRYCQRFPTIQKALDDARDTNLDYAEGQLMRAVKAGNVTAIMFLLKTVGKSRGYVDRQEIQHEGNLNVSVSWDGDDDND